MKPIAIVATAGTVATGAVDPVTEPADLASEFDLWLHVDGAYGGIAALVESLAPQFAGIERADSIGLDPHKWLCTPHSGSCLLLGDAEGFGQTFSVASSYTHEDKSLTGHGADWHRSSPFYSRGFSALKVWVSLLAHGWEAYERRIAHDCELARYLFELAGSRAELETFGPQRLSIACRRYVPLDLREHPGSAQYLNMLNERLMYALQESGRVFPSNAVLDGRFVLRACIVNSRAEAEDVEAAVELSIEHGRRLDAALRTGHLS